MLFRSKIATFYDGSKGWTVREGYMGDDSAWRNEVILETDDIVAVLTAVTGVVTAQRERVNAGASTQPNRDAPMHGPIGLPPFTVPTTFTLANARNMPAVQQNDTLARLLSHSAGGGAAQGLASGTAAGAPSPFQLPLQPSANTTAHAAMRVPNLSSYYDPTDRPRYETRVTD